MGNLLESLYDSFYIPPVIMESEWEIEVCHRELNGRLGKLERRLLLKIIDESAHIADELSLDIFICGF